MMKKKCLVFSCLLSWGLAEPAFASQEKNIVQTFLTEQKHVFDDLPLEMQQELGSAILCNHPIIPFLIRELGKVHTALKGHTALVTAAYFNERGDKVVTASKDRTAKIFDVASGACLHTLEGHTDWVDSALFSEFGDKVVTKSKDGTSRIWDVASGRCLKKIKGHTHLLNLTESIYPKDKMVSCGGKTAHIFEVPTSGKSLPVLVGHSDRVNSARLTGAGDKVVTASSDDTAKIWDASNGRCLRTLGHSDVVRQARFNEAGDKVITVSGSHDPVPKIWDLRRHTLLIRLLQSQLTHKQAFLLMALYETIVCRALIRECGSKAFNDDEQVISYEKVRFDFNKFPLMEQTFKTLPAEVQDILRPYVLENHPKSSDDDNTINIQ
jgi:WD40 repeat protein